MSAPQRLPVGRHGLSRELVDQNQRGRLIAGVIATVAVEGYNNATVAKIIARAGISRTTFYQHFSDRRACFLAAHADVCARLRNVAATAGSSQSDWPGEVTVSVEAVLAFLAAEPELLRFCLAPCCAEDEGVRACYDAMIAAAAAHLFAGAPVRQRRSPPFENALVGGAAFLLSLRVERGEADRLADLGPQMTEFLLAPYREAPPAAAPGPA